MPHDQVRHAPAAEPARRGVRDLDRSRPQAQVASGRGRGRRPLRAAAAWWTTRRARAPCGRRRPPRASPAGSPPRASPRARRHRPRWRRAQDRRRTCARAHGASAAASATTVPSRAATGFAVDVAHVHGGRHGTSSAARSRRSSSSRSRRCAAQSGHCCTCAASGGSLLDGSASSANRASSQFTCDPSRVAPSTATRSFWRARHSRVSTAPLRQPEVRRDLVGRIAHQHLQHQRFTVVVGQRHDRRANVVEAVIVVVPAERGVLGGLECGHVDRLEALALVQSGVFATRDGQQPRRAPCRRRSANRSSATRATASPARRPPRRSGFATARTRTGTRRRAVARTAARSVAVSGPRHPREKTVERRRFLTDSAIIPGGVRRRGR